MPLGTESTWLRRFSTAAPPRLRLLCLPHAGGSASFFHGWGHAFGDDVEVLAVRYPGRQERIAEEPWTSLEELADALTGELEPYLDAPLAIFGHSMGATVGYEIAHRMQERYATAPQLLMVSCRKAPRLLTPDTAAFGTDAELVEAVKQLGGTDSALLDDEDLRELVLPAIRGDFTAVAGYAARPGVPLPCPVVGYVGDRDPGVPAEAVAAWAEIAPHGFDLKVLAGDHFYLLDRRDELVEDIRARLAPQR
ncbi:thioesterase II family protein [Streptomyces antimicrobicus]|uniref:Alpha/beta fold hydrolase n=1 Tax=Streptomyces antimicrobicus TaxID=2883108 RepID=A0ABS8BA81_9ACTN|nr:alpha/beta fold hydrolase [Streptomyces antimicrobicus]MCB5181536.1 alpha/beta fold hydrolase [Streptomyces antimicrobicus]